MTNAAAYLVTVDRLASSSIASGEVSTLGPGDELMPYTTNSRALSRALARTPPHKIQGDWTRQSRNSHEVLDDPVEGRALVSEAELLAIGSLSGTQSSEVFDGLRDSPVGQLQGRECWAYWRSLSVQTHDDPSERLASMLNVKEHLGSQIALSDSRLEERSRSGRPASEGAKERKGSRLE